MGSGEPVEESGVLGRYPAQLVQAEDALQVFPLLVGQAGGGSPESVRDARELVLPGRVLVVCLHAAVTRPDRPFDLLRF
jgi:hypothetical protein